MRPSRQPTAWFMTRVTCRLTAKNRDQLRNTTLGSRRTHHLEQPAGQRDICSVSVIFFPDWFFTIFPYRVLMLIVILY